VIGRASDEPLCGDFAATRPDGRETGPIAVDFVRLASYTRFAREREQIDSRLRARRLRFRLHFCLRFPVQCCVRFPVHFRSRFGRDLGLRFGVRFRVRFVVFNDGIHDDVSLSTVAGVSTDVGSSAGVWRFSALLLSEA
jgi:hypothetical protein